MRNRQHQTYRTVTRNMPTPLTTNEEPWQSEAACINQMDLFYSDDAAPPTGEENQARVKAAKELCATCPVRRDCFGYAVKNRERYGVWGGENFGNTDVRARIFGPPQ